MWNQTLLEKMGRSLRAAALLAAGKIKLIN
jgi:hypothetical protein